MAKLPSTKSLWLPERSKDINISLGMMKCSDHLQNLLQFGHASLIFNSLWLSGVIGKHRFGSTLAQLRACRLTAASYHQTNVDFKLVRFSGIHHRAILHDEFENHTVKIIARDQRVNNNAYGDIMVVWFNSSPLDKMATILQTFLNAFSLMKMFEFRLKFHWNLYLWV